MINCKRIIVKVIAAVSIMFLIIGGAINISQHSERYYAEKYKKGEIPQMAKYRCERCGAELPNYENNADFYNFKAKVYLKNYYGTYWQYLLCQNCTDKLMNWIMAGTENTECINGENRQNDNEVKNNGI